MFETQASRCISMCFINFVNHTAGGLAVKLVLDEGVNVMNGISTSHISGKRSGLYHLHGSRRV